MGDDADYDYAWLLAVKEMCKKAEGEALDDAAYWQRVEELTGATRQDIWTAMDRNRDVFGDVVCRTSFRRDSKGNYKHSFT
jgi:hypothetical protein